MLTRRDLLKKTVSGATLLAISPTVPTFLARTALAAGPSPDGRVLVVIQLDGGNDAINTLVPFRDEGYARSRNTLRIDRKDLIRVDDEVGLHPGLRDLGKVLERGQLALVPGVGYPNPNRSHFESMAIWQTARLDPEEHSGSGWIGRGLDAAIESGRGRVGTAGAMFIGDGTPPAALRARRAATTALNRLDDLVLPEGWPTRAAAPAAAGAERLEDYIERTAMDAYAASERVATLIRTREDREARYPGTPLAGRLQTIARLLKAGLGARVFYTVQSGYDTHAGQANAHFSLLSELGGGIKAFLDDLGAARLGDRVVVMGFSEFGRRVAENGSAGTDHGTAGLVFLAGSSVRPGVHGKVPSLTDLVDGDPKISTDFRRVYASTLASWLDLPTRTALGANFEKMELFAAGPVG